MSVATQNNVFKLYDVDSGKALDGVVTLQLPPFELASNEFSGAGLAGKINVPAPGVMNALAATISCPVIYGEILKYMELGETKTLDLRNEMIVVNSDTHQPERVPQRWVLKGPLSKSDPGKVEQAAASDASIDIQIYYAANWVDGEAVLEFDPFKMIYTVNGKDMLELTRQNVLVG